MGIRRRLERKAPQDARREKIVGNCKPQPVVFSTQSARSRGLGEGRLCSLGKSEAYGGAPANFALNPGGAPVKIDNRLY